jgi:aminoglycoside phosphotransferase (APT) family kinase protein
MIEGADMDVQVSGEMDRQVFAWLETNLGRVVRFRRHARWRIGWDADVERGGLVTGLYIRGPRGENYISPVDMRQEAAIHRTYRANGIPAPRVIALIDEPCCLVIERLAGSINTATIADPDARRRVREEFIETIARQHRIAPSEFAETALTVPVGADAVSRNLYAASEAIFDQLIGRPWPLMRFVGRWLERNVPADRTQPAFINADAGQFLFDGDRLTGLIDFEMSCFGDPLAELAGIRLRDTSEPLGDLSALYDHYEKVSGAKVPKRLIEYHTAGYCGVNGFMLWPLAFSSTREQDYLAYLNFAVATSRWCVSAMAEHDGIRLDDPPEPNARPMGYCQAGAHLERQIADLPAANAAGEYDRDAAAALARYQQRWLTYGAAVLEADFDDCEELLGTRPASQADMMTQLETHVLRAGLEEDAKLIRHFHRWLRRQDFLLTSCGIASYNVGLDLQVIPKR